MLGLNKIEKKTFIMLIVSVILNGMAQSILFQRDIIGKKTFDGLDWQITILAMLMPASSIISLWWGKWLENSNNKQRFYLVLAIGSRLLLVVGLVIFNANQFIILIAIVFGFNSLLSPLQNSLLQANFRKDKISKVFGYVISTNTIIVIISAYLLGKVLDTNEDLIGYVFMVCGIAGFLGMFLLSRIRFVNRQNFIKKKYSLKEVIVSPVYRALQIFRDNKEFMKFEINFMIYGIGFLVVLPAIPKYFVEYLQVDYSTIFFAKGILSQMLIFFLTPFVGKIFSKYHPELFSSISFFVLSFYPLGFLISSFIPNKEISLIFVYGAYIIFGVAMSGVIMSWNISSLYFAKDEDVSMYQSVHITMVGIRGFIVPSIGYLILRFLGMRAVFTLSFIAFIVASISSINHYIKIHKTDYKQFSYRVFQNMWKLTKYTNRKVKM